eukprot:1187406-Rhodomonas_salina.3
MPVPGGAVHDIASCASAAAVTDGAPGASGTEGTLVGRNPRIKASGAGHGGVWYPVHCILDSLTQAGTIGALV